MTYFYSALVPQRKVGLVPSSIGLGEAVGIGCQLIETKDYTLEVEVGPGVRQSQLRDTDDFEAK
jgi:hypothetical protein